MLIALDLSLLGDVTATIFAGIFFLISGIAIGFALGRRMYLAPLIEIETELRKSQNEALREKIFSESTAWSAANESNEPGSEQDSRHEHEERPPLAAALPRSTEPSLSRTEEHKAVRVSDSDADYISELRLDLEERTLERDLVQKSYTEDVSLFKSEIEELKKAIRDLRGTPVEVVDIVESTQAPGYNSDDYELKVSDSLIQMEDQPEPETIEGVETASLSSIPSTSEPSQPADAARDSVPDSSPDFETVETLLDTVSVWTKKLFDLIDPGPLPSVEESAPVTPDFEPSIPVESDITAEPERPAIPEPPAVSQNPSKPDMHANRTRLQSGSWGDGAEADFSLPAFKPLSTFVPEDEDTDSVSRFLSLDPNQASILRQMGLVSFRQIAELTPMDIIRVASTLNVPINLVQNVWRPAARSRLEKETR